MSTTIDPITGTATSDLSRLPDSTPAAPATASTVPTTPEVPPTLEPLPPLSFETAKARHKELWGDKDWVGRYMDGGKEEARQQAQVWNSINGSQPAPASQSEAILNHLGQSGPVLPAAREEILSGRASTPADVAEAEDAKRTFFQDEAWMERYRKGGRLEHAQVNTINLILSRRTRDEPFQP